MRTLKLTLVALIIGTSTLLATTTATPDLKGELRAQILELLATPEFTVEENVTVNIEFTFSTAGEIVVLKIDSYDKAIVSWVRENLNYQKISDPGTAHKVYSVPLTLTSEMK